jgi:hypothetical protein
MQRLGAMNDSQAFAHDTLPAIHDYCKRYLDVEYAFVERYYERYVVNGE